MFDYAITGKPQIFYLYDLQTYRDKLRGFYFDLAELPGPTTEAYEQMVAYSKDPSLFEAGYADRYRAFRAKFNNLDDGAAAARVVDRLFAAKP
jgi:CDP-glycerol glycerophosphotransferase